MPPAFIYFDLGNVLLNFSHHRAAAQMAEVAGVDAEQVYKLVFEGDLERRSELGELNARELYDIFCQETGATPDFAELERAGSDIFELNQSMLPVIGHLDVASYRMGVLSNTSESHWNFVTAGRWGILNSAFDVYALSYKIGAMKPDPAIYTAAAELAGVAPEEIFFTDDREENIAGARQAGYDAVQFTTPTALIRDLRERGVRFNC